jgi:uncharacterized protein YyaL (SSP411 family)
VRAGTPDSVNIAKAREVDRARLFEWLPYEKASFDRAANEGKFILLDGAAEWCHWCHVMDATTYTDPEVGALLRDRFITIRVNIDEHPDVAERYGDYGWPATILLSSSAQELGKLRGFVPKEELLPTLRSLTVASQESESESVSGNRPAQPSELPWVVGHVLFEFDDYYDDELGGWGRRQKAPLGENLQFEARRALRGDARAKARLQQTVRAQHALIDPVWGGLYQYSDGGSWDRPHFEKLMTYQAANLAGYAEGFRASQDAAVLADGRAVLSYMTNFLSDESGLFFVSQDADVGSHEPTARFVDGHVFYQKDDAGRRSLGMPRIDKSTYPFENGLAITAVSNFGAAVADPQVIAVARKAADKLLASNVDAEGRVFRGNERDRSRRFLADAASLGLGLVELAQASAEPRYAEVALHIAQRIELDFASPEGGFFASTADPNAVGVFSQRRRPFESNVLVVRLLARLAVQRNDESLRVRASALLAAMSTPRALSKQGRMLGSYLLAADDLGLIR